jgi:hypothetical protein
VFVTYVPIGRADGRGLGTGEGLDLHLAY